ncbi:hypothetical protein [Methylophaga sp.]|uniref:hypothetical protein n=1 Tax=Methylophaga sp. TaxID=2024840 RepID=UPI003F69AE8C
MMCRVFALWLSLLSQPLLADTTAMELKHSNGDVLSIQKLASGEVWASFFLSDRMVASFAGNELIVIQVDEHKPVKLEQGFRSCGAPAPEAQQVVYQFAQPDPSTWSYSGQTQPKQDVLKVLGWDNDQFNTVSADRRPEVVDFPLDPSALLTSQLRNAGQLSFRYVTTRGEQRQTIFNLTPHQHILDPLLP